MKEYKCLYCNIDTKFGRSKRNKFCSLQCQANYQFEFITKPKIESNLVHDPRTLKKFLIKIIGCFCVICNLDNRWNEKELVLQLDHIDGDSDNNYPSNLRLLCPNCHSQTDTFCSKGGSKLRKQTRRNSYNRKFKNQ